MKKIIASAVVSVLLCLVLAACSEPVQHTHTYSDAWSYDESSHWRAATCEHSDEVTDKSSHIYNRRVCNCGARAVSAGLEYALTDDGYTIVGPGSCNDFELVISSTYENKPVIGIADNAFEYCSKLISITLPESIESIGENAFSGCIKLIEVYNKSALDITLGSEENGRIAYYAKNVYTPTEGFSKITTDNNGYVSYADSVASEYYIVAYNGVATRLTLPTSINGSDYCVYQYAFFDCRNIVSISAGNSLIEIGDYAFFGCRSLVDVTLGNSTTSIGEFAFGRCTSMVEILIGNSVISIGDRAFINCSSLTDVNMGNSVESIGECAFERCVSLSSITIKNSVTFIGERAFNDCFSLTRAVFNNVDDWKCADDAISASELSDSAVAASLLTEQYCDEAWTRE